MRVWVAVLLGLLVPATLGQPNMVVFVLDDVGVDQVAAYQESPDPPCTPQMDALASGGVLFRNAWANPSCSPTRAQILTGRHARNSGVGAIVRRHSDRAVGLTIPGQTLPRELSAIGYETAMIGKWHLADADQGLLHPNQAGFDYYAGSMFNLSTNAPGPDPYRNWQKNTQGVLSLETDYATLVTSQDAVAAAAAMTPPWFLQVSYNAPHAPFHWPPEELCPQACATARCGLEIGGTRAQIRAAIEVLDDQLGHTVAGLRALDPNVIVFVVGDNGSVPKAVQPPFDPNRAKNTIYEGGINVPLFVNGPRITPGGESAALVSMVDLFATVIELAGGATAPSDSTSFAPQLLNPDAPGAETILAESFDENFDPAAGFPRPRRYQRAIRDQRYKLIRILDPNGTSVQLYDLQDDPFERVDRMLGVTPTDMLAYERLTAGLVAYGAAPPADFDGDGVVGLSDLATILANFGRREGSHARGDADLNGEIDLADLAALLASFGQRG